jgi:hypothetical protein
MGKRGPAKDPTALTLLKGVTDKRQLNLDEPKPPEVAVSMPDWAEGDDEWQVRWRQVFTFALSQWPWVLAADEQMFQQYVTAVVDAERLGRALLRSPLLERDPANGGPKALTVRREWQSALKTAQGLAMQFGGTSSSRTSLKATMLQPEGVGTDAGADALFG